ncbi:MAG: hypothetical protein JW915_10545 [Chitinispirillaceae bacterium]|nr:hypothetical protein [Chitinispirillaceae bacterium]
MAECKAAIKKFLKCGNDSFFYGLIDDSPTMIAPIENTKIKNSLKGSNEAESPESFFVNDCNYEDVVSDIDKLRKFFSNGTLNPGTKSHLIDVYIGEDSEELKALDARFLEKDGWPNRNILITGNKGVGKTALQNYWLYTRNNRIEAKKIFYIRCDGHKLYECWIDANNTILKSNNNEITLVTVEDYLLIQLLYVFCKYCDHPERRMFNEIYSLVTSEENTYCHYSGRSVKEGEKTIAEGIALAKKGIDSEVSKKDSYSIDVIKNAHSITNNTFLQKRNWLSLSSAIKKIMKNNGYKILNIIDGIDNIEMFESQNTSLYTKFLEQISPMLFEAPPENEIYLAALRPRTFFEVRQVVRLQQIVEVVPHRILYQSQCHARILAKRINYVLPLLENERLKNILISMKDVYGEVPLCSENLDYHHNCRLYLSYSINLALTVLYRWICVDEAKSSGRIPLHEEFNMEAQLRIWKNRNKFLNGRFYIPKSNRENRKRRIGKYCFNLFGYTSKFSRSGCDCSNWPVLSCVRLLQLLKQCVLLSEEDIIDFLHEAFGYSDIVTLENIQSCAAFGLIDTELGEHPELGNTSSEDVCFSYRLSDKGEAVLNMVFEDIDIIYLLALSTPIPSKFIIENYIKAHSNHIDRPVNYAISMLRTTFVFIKSLMVQEEIELLRNPEAKFYSGKKLSISKDAFRLPFHGLYRKKKLILRIEYFLDNFNDENRCQFIAFLDKLSAQTTRLE